MDDYQKKLFPYAYNILGSYDDAIDAVQDVITKYYSSPKAGIDNESNYLIRSVINQSINLKKRGSRSIGNKQLLPEPISTESADGNVIRTEIISYSLMVLLDAVNAKERAVFILKEAFDYSHEEISDTLQISIENSRKLLSRARIKLDQTKQKKINKTSFGKLQLEKYINAIKRGNLKELEALLISDIEVRVDGGALNIVSAFERGVNDVINLMIRVYETYQRDFQVEIVEVNHQPALLFYENGILRNCQIFEFEAGTSVIMAIYSIVDPEKLKNFNKF